MQALRRRLWWGVGSFWKKARVAIERGRAFRSEKSLLLVGLRGVEKTVLLRTIADMAEELECQVIFIETPEDQSLPELLAPPLREALLKLDRMAGLNEKVKRALRVFRSFLGTIKVGNEHIAMEIDPEVGTGDSGNLQADLSALFVAVAEAAKARGTTLVLLLGKLDENFFRVRFDRLTPSEKKYLRAMAELGDVPHRSGDVAAQLGAAVQAVAPVRSSLIRKGMAYSPAYGDIDFTVPLFAAFMRRAMPFEGRQTT